MSNNNDFYIWWNGRLKRAEELSVPLTAHALHYGTSAFEGIRFYETDEGKRAVFRLKDHIKRLRYSAKALGMPSSYSQKDLERAVLDTVGAVSFQSGYIRPIIFRGEGGLGLDPRKNKVHTAVMVLPWSDYLPKKGIKVKIVSRRRISPLAFDPQAKWGGVYVNSILAHLEAQKAKADEALLLDQKGYIAEGAGENVFFRQGNKLITPEEGSILPGITRDAVMSMASDLGYKIEEKRIKPASIKNFQECILVGTAAEITPVAMIDGEKVGNGEIGEAASSLIEQFNGVVRGRVKKYQRWLTWVD